MQYIVQVENVKKVFGGLVAVKDVSFKVEKNKIFGVIGPNGAGKTTLFNLITGTYPVSGGKILFKDMDITDKTVFEIARLGVSRTFQNIKLMGNQSIIDNVMLGRHSRIRSGFIQSVLRTRNEREEEMKSLKYCMDVLDFLGLADMWDRPAGSLSYGEQRLLEIARALATEPELIFFDEPAAGMNGVEGERLIQIIKQVRERGITPVVIEHDMKVIMSICEELVVLDHGELICSGEPEKVKNDPRVIEAYLGKEVDFSALKRERHEGRVRRD